MAWWWPLGFGVWTATYTLSQGLLDVPLTFLSFLLHLAVALLAVWWMRRVRGTYPSGRSPRELNGSFALLFVGAASRGRGSVASFRITRTGRAAFARHGATLRALLGAQQPPVDDDFRQDADPR